MIFNKIVVYLLCALVVDAIANDNSTNKLINEFQSDVKDFDKVSEENAANVFNGVYTECFLYLSYSCLQKKTLLYLKELNKLSEVSVIGEYVKFVKVNNSEHEEINASEVVTSKETEELSFLIDKAVNKFFNNHILKFHALGKDVTMPQSVEEFVGRKRKGGGGGGGGGHGGGDDGGKKKMMMMAMMCMKMKLMMMVPAMMGMMGMMSFKGMMFSMMSFMISKMMLLMKILEKKGGGGGGGGGGGDGGWPAGGGGGGGAWMPAGGQDFGGGGGGGGGGYDANGQWQSRSIIDNEPEPMELNKKENKPIITYVTPIVRYNNINLKKPYSLLKNLNDEVIKINQGEKPKSRNKRGIVDLLQNAYVYWINRVLGVNNKKYYPKYPKYKVMHGVKYVYYPIKQVKIKKPKEIQATDHITATTEADVEYKPIVTSEDFNKGEIVEGPIESRMNKKKMTNLKNAVNEAIDENPWE